MPFAGRTGSLFEIPSPSILDRRHLVEAMTIGTTEALLRDPIMLTAPVSLKRRGIELRLVYASPDARLADRDPHLIDLVRRGWAAWTKLTTEQRSTNPVELTARSLLRSGELPIDWKDQRQALGFA